MAAEADKKKENPKPDEAAPAQAEKPAKAGMGSLVKYLLYGGIGLVAVIAIAFGTFFLVGGQPSSPESPEASSDSTSQVQTPAAPADSAAGADDLEALVAKDTSLNFLDQAALIGQSIASNLEALDHAPTESDLAAAEASATTGDSLAAMDWLAQEKVKLTERENELDAREKDLKVRESKLLQGITRIEQAESSRIAKLAGLYDNMDPMSVAKLAANLDDGTVVALLPRMKPKNASAVLALMPPARAAKLSQQMVTIAEN